MKVPKFLLLLAAILALQGVMTPGLASGQSSDVLYIGDGGDDKIKMFDALTGQFMGESEGPEISGLAGPRGLVIVGNQLWVANQNLGRDIPGEVLRFDAMSGVFLNAIVPFTSKNAPFAPDGLVSTGSDLLVNSVIRKANTGPPGRVNHFDSNGTFLGEMKVKNNEHHPRGIVFGPDGMPYVSCRDLTNGLGGTVLRFNNKGKADVFIDDKGGVGRLNRPDGLVFGPDGLLYVTSFRAEPGDTDSIRVYNGNGALVRKIDLHNGTSDQRVYAQSVLFGPQGKLFVPLNNTGQVRRYNSATTGDYSVVVAGGGPLISPFYLTFGRTDPSTLNYESVAR